jgi:putative oxidoreductase
MDCIRNIDWPDGLAGTILRGGDARFMTSIAQSTPWTSSRAAALPLGHIARGLLSLPFLVFGALHFVAGAAMAGAVPGWLPGGVAWVYLTGAALVAGAVGLHLRRFVVPAAIGLAALMVVFAFTVHLPAMADEATRQLGMMGLLKDLGLAGGALAVALLRR